MQEKILEVTAEEIVNHFFESGARVGTKDLLYIKMALEKAREEGYGEGVEKAWQQAREEGRKEAEIAWSLDWKLSIENDAITQYKEELLGELSIFDMTEILARYNDDVKGIVIDTIDKTLSEIKKIIN